MGRATVPSFYHVEGLGLGGLGLGVSGFGVGGVYRLPFRSDVSSGRKFREYENLPALKLKPRTGFKEYAGCRNCLQALLIVFFLGTAIPLVSEVSGSANCSVSSGTSPNQFPNSSVILA